MHLVLLDPAVPIARRSPMKPVPVSLVNLLAQRPRIGSAVATGLAKLEGAERLVKNALSQYCADGSSLDPRLVAALIQAERDRIGRGHAYLGYMQAYRSMLAPAARQALRPGDGETGRCAHAPGCGGGGYARLDRAHRAADDGLDGLDYQEMDGVGHNPQMQAPGRFLSVLFEWLAARDGTPV